LPAQGSAHAKLRQQPFYGHGYALALILEFNANLRLDA